MRATAVFIAVASAWCMTACAPIPNSGLQGTNYSGAQTKTTSGRPVLAPGSEVVLTEGQLEGSLLVFRSIRPAVLETGLTDAGWDFAQGLYIPMETVREWADGGFSTSFGPRLDPQVAGALVACAPDLGRVASLPVSMPSAAFRVGRVTVGEGDGARVFLQFITVRARWRTALGTGAGGGGESFRILPEEMEVFGATQPIPTDRRLVTEVQVAYVPVNAGQHRSLTLLAGPTDLGQVRGSCAPDGRLLLSGVRTTPPGSPNLPGVLESFNMSTSVIERAIP